MAIVDGGIIGGTGIGSRLMEQLTGEDVTLITRYGPLRGRITEHAGQRLFLIQRHSRGHKTPPHLVNYRAMAAGLQELSARFCLATAAVGSLDPDMGPGSFAVCRDFLDVSNRQPTLYDRVVRHVDFTLPMGSAARTALIEETPGAATTNAVYVCVNGPRYETPHEIQTYRNWGGTVVGMTAASEAIVMREAGIDYACISIVTNFASGISPGPLDHSEVTDVMNDRGAEVVAILLRAAARLQSPVVA